MFQELSVEEIYSSSQKERYLQILQEFKQRYGDTADFVARAPGRVNLIGEHIDYEGYGVLPFAIEKDCVIAVKLHHSNTIEINHVCPDKYPTHIISSNPHDTPHYLNPYVRFFFAGYQAILKEPIAVEQKPKETKFQGMKVLIEGNVPTGSGLSSSSSLCICSALVTLRANGLEECISKDRFISQVIKYERMVGTACGGMDQSISVLGVKSSALFVQFDPIRCVKVDIPKGFGFVIANSLEESNKIEALGGRYNKRVCECYMAVQTLGRKLSVPAATLSALRTLKDLQDYCKLSLQEMQLVVERFLEDRELTREEVEESLGPLPDLLAWISNSSEVYAIKQTFHLHNAAKHVYSEADRVLRFINVCNSSLPPSAKATLLGNLMNQSQDSCRDHYKCSSRLLDQLTTLALSSGALGSRLTGAGWGGCNVSLVQQSKIPQFIQHLKTKYYDKPEFSGSVKSLGFDNLVFESVPVEGASFVRID